VSLRALARYFTRFGSPRGAWQALRFPGIHVAAGARLSVRGELLYGRGCSIAAGSNIMVPRHCALELGNNCSIGRYVELSPGGRMEFGDETSIQDRGIFVGDVKVGRYCSISLNVHMSSGRHHFDLIPSELIKDQDRSAVRNGGEGAEHSRPVIVEDDCWIGINAVIMPGIRVGKGSVVGANSVVTKDVAPYTVVAGVPAKFIKERLTFSPPRAILFGEHAHWPYFYSGFAVSRDAMKAHAPHGGLVAQGSAVLALNTDGAEFLCVSAKSIDGDDMKLAFRDQSETLTSQFREISFRLADAAGDRADRLTLRAEPSAARWSIEKAWVR
jgi:acetyltransferase-like isoleucine patch superfamily enzyme